MCTGLVFEKMSNTLEPVAPFALRHFIKLSRDDFEKLCSFYNVAVAGPRGKSPTLRMLAEALVAKLFPDEPPETREAFVDAQCRAQKAALNGSTKDLPGILEQMRDDRSNWQEFSHLTKVLQPEDKDGTDEREFRGRGPRVNVTPQALRELVPGHCGLPGIYLVHQRSARECSGYYLGGSPNASTGRTWDGPRACRSEVEAVTLVVHWLWDQHIRAGLAVLSDRPSEAKIQAACDAMVRSLAPGVVPVAGPGAAAGGAAVIAPMVARGRGRGRLGRGRRGG
jgi:hypothetical protein